jgi:hypothetical protein
MKDSLGHGSNNRGSHVQGITAIPRKGSPIIAAMSERMYHDTMPIANYTGQVQDLLGLWGGSQKPEPLTADETKQVNDAYSTRADWHSLAARIKDQRAAATLASGPKSAPAPIHDAWSSTPGGDR